ncbi:hypothetical protein FF80_03352 [Devosia sp. LC5]|uniref:phage tail tip fiber protein n=1 Tax=Devosia sp. LC5 TaxID=1502724 RepID=UPI0004E2F986|nr:hypothetical protein [Devosia sp. LC5]KFC62785.1 hypothetical protein FF80_03352 [Devosia sp. LC5]
MVIFTAIGTAVAGALFAGSALAASIIAGGLSFGASLLLSSLTRPKAARNEPYSAVQGQIQYGAQVPVSALFGEGKVRGHHVYYAKYGSGNKYNADVFILANGWCDGLDGRVYFYGEKHDLVARPIIGNEISHYGVSGFDNLISIRFYDGRPGQGVDTKLVADTAALGNTWKATSVCAGMTYVVVEREYDADKFNKGRPDFEFVLRGLREYDPRKDSTVAGGSGPQRIDDPATWVHTKNPVVHRLNYQLGLRGLLSGRTLVGEGKSLGQLDLGTYFAAMNVADTPRLGKPTYEASIFVNGEDDHTEVLKELDDAIAGYALNRRGLSGVIAGAPQIPVASITADDIPVGRAQEVQRRKSAFGLFNYISGQFTSPESLWNPESLTPVFVNLDVAADGRVRQTSNDFLQVTDPDIAQYLLNIRYRQNRKGGSATVPVSRRVGLNVQEGEWVEFDGLEWLVTGWRCDAQFRCTLTLAETGADVYSEAGIEPGPIVVPPTAPLNPSLLSTVQNFSAAVGFIQNSDGEEAPVLEFTWTPPEDPSMTAVRFFYFVGEDPTGQTVYQDQTTDVEAGTYATTKNIIPGVHYTARATITTVPDRLKTYTPWVTTEIITGPFTLGLDAIADEVAEKVAELDEWTRYNTRETIEEKRKAILLNVAGAVGDYNDRQHIRQEAASTFEASKASWSLDILTATGPNSALSLRIEQLDAEVFDPVTGLPAVASAVDLLSTEVNDPGTGLQAVGNAILSLVSSVPGASAEGLMRIYTSAAAVGEEVRIALSAATSGADGPANAALYITAGGGNSDILLVANRIAAVTGPAGAKYGIFVVDAGVVWMDEARIRNLTAANIQTRSLTADKLVAGTLTSAEINVQQLVASNAFLTYLRVGSAQIDDLSVGRIKIANGAVTDFVTHSASGAGTTNQLVFDGPTFIATDGPWIETATASSSRTTAGSTNIDFVLVNVSTGALLTVAEANNSMSHSGIRMGTPGQTYRYRITASTTWDDQSGSWTINLAFGATLWRK